MLTSYGWEAIYTKKPEFSKDLDYCLFDSNQLIGIVAGHKIEAQSSSVYSIEILALEATYHKKGINASLLIEIFKSIPAESLIQFWTKDKNVRSYYEQSLNFLCIHSLSHQKKREGKQEFWVTEESNQDKASILCYACTEKQIHNLKPSGLYSIEYE